MSSIYKNLSKAGTNVENKSPVILPRPDFGYPAPPSFTGIKVAIVGAFIIALGAFALSIFLYRSLADAKGSREKIERNYVALKEETQTLGAEADQYRSEIQRMSDQLKNYSTQRSELNQELSRSRVEISNLEKKMKEIEDRNQRIEKETRQLTQSTPVSRAATQATVPTQSVPQPAAAEPVAGPQSPTSGTAVAGESKPSQKVNQVMTVNRKFNFVVVNLGIRDQLKIGDRLAVERAGKSVGFIEVEKLYDSFAAATIVEERDNAQIKEGDPIRKV
ncbi:MAG: hypothetical protein Q8R76_06485 [Candidatus Omnitrophota bacterium]|nr:hypothetical protein [Candidatus Omnitrophota bacterium]